MSAQQQWKHEVAHDLTVDGYEQWLLERTPYWVVSAHAFERSAVTWWFPEHSGHRAFEQFGRECADATWPTRLRLVKMLVPSHLSHDETTEHIDSDLDWVEAFAPPMAEVWTYDPSNDDPSND